MGEILSVKKPRMAGRMIEILWDKILLPQSLQKNKPNLAVDLIHAQTSFSVSYAFWTDTMMFRFKATWTHWQCVLPVRGIWLWIWLSDFSPYWSSPWRNGNMAGCPWRGRFITPQRRSCRAPQGSPSYVGGHRSEVPLCLCCSPPEWARSIQAYRLQIALIGIADRLGGKRNLHWHSDVPAHAANIPLSRFTEEWKPLY